MAEMSLWLDSYDDIFSDFDPRNYQKRRISEDFLDELKASMKYHTEYFDSLVLLLPKQLRKEEIENEILSGIKEQLHIRHEALKNKSRRIYSRGVTFMVSGIVMMAIDSFIAYKGYKTYSMMMLRVLMEPAGWFLICQYY